MRRSICYSEPSIAYAGDERTWKFIFTTASPLQKGARLRFDMQNKGRSIDWEKPDVSLKKGDNVIYAVTEKGKILQAKEIETPDSPMPIYEFVLPAALPSGESITFCIGALEGKKGGNKAQTFVQRRRPFLLYIDPTGKGRFEEPEVFTLDIRGSKLSTIKVIAPSFVVKNKRFDVTVRFEDEYGNLTSLAPEDTLIELSYEHIRENLNWKLFVPETGFISLPNLYFNEPGVYTIKLLNTKTKEVFKSAPIKCFAENDKHLFWGLLHGESERMDSTENIESCLRHFRDEKALSFFGTSAFESNEETPNEIWKQISQNITDFNEDYRFTTFLGFQWQGTPKEEGVRIMLFSKDNKPILRKKDLKYNNLKKIYKIFTPKDLISIPSFTMGKGFEYDFKEFTPEFERVVEIYNAWGSSECTKKEGNPKPIMVDGKEGIQESADGSIQNALLRNYRFGFVAGGLDDRGIYSELFEGDQVQYPPGLTAIIAQEHSREGILDALYRRSCYATTGERIIVGMNLAGFPMGSEISTANKVGLMINRHLSIYVAGTTKLKTIEVIRNGKVIHTFKPDNYYLTCHFDDMTPLEKVVIKPQDKKSPPFVYYYLRITQEDGHMAWGSPIWIDLVPPAPKSNAKPLAKPAAKKPLISMEEDEEDFEDFDEE